MIIKYLAMIIIFAPLLGSVVSGLFCGLPSNKILAHRAAILGVAIAFSMSLYLGYVILYAQHEAINFDLYTWANGGEFFPYAFNLGLLIDPLTVIMLIVVTFISLLVHIYSIGYMVDDAGYQRFFSYISLFTFMMLMLVSANNFLQLFFGWEGVGLVSYLLIGFWHHKEAAIQGGLKAFMVNRIGDFGFILGMGLIFSYTGSLDYQAVFNHVPHLRSLHIELLTGHSWQLLTVICLLLFVGAMGKSAQVPLHIWLPESMEGPTPISALIHAATMVTAGVFMLCRISPLLEYSTTALTFIMVIGATGALFTGILALVMHDIKRVIAYSTLSQLGYMMVAMGISAYSAGMFHLITHACFKALLFLAAGSVIVGMHHEQDMRKMGGLWRKMPLTYVSYVIGSLALCAIPPFSGFFSKDTIIDAVQLAAIPGSSYAYFCVSLGAMITAIYTFRSLIMTFHGAPRMDAHAWEHVCESPWTIWLPLLLLAIPSIALGYFLLMPMLYTEPTILTKSLMVLPEHDLLGVLAHEVYSPGYMLLHIYNSFPYWLTIAGILLAVLLYGVFPNIPNILANKFALTYRILTNKYGFDAFNDYIIVNGSKSVGRILYKIGDQRIIDSWCVNGTAMTIEWFAKLGRRVQSGYLYHYVAVMVLGLLMFLCWLLLG